MSEYGSYLRLGQLYDKNDEILSKLSTHDDKIDIQMGGKGSIFIDDTSTHTGSWAEIYAISAAVPAAITIGSMTGSSGLVGSTIAAGSNIRGDITKLRLTSGRVIAYKDST